MKGFPKNIQSREDILNCAELVKLGELSKSDFAFALNKIDNLSYMTLPIIDITTDGLQVVINKCSEITKDSTIFAAGDMHTKISILDVYTFTPEEYLQDGIGDSMSKPEFTKLTLEQSVSGETYLKLLLDITEYDRLGITKEEVESIRRELDV